MRFKLPLLALGVSAAALAAPAYAQDATAAQFYIGPSAGYHDLGVDDEDLDDEDLDGFDISDGGFIGGLVAGVDVPVGTSAFVGVEGNFHVGTDAIDSEYGVAARLGANVGNGKVFVKAGYQWVDLDLANLTGIDGIEDVDGLEIEDTIDDFVVGVGGEFGLGGARLRIGVDTVSFDTIRPNAAILFAF